LPPRGEGPSKRQEIVDPALEMADRLVHAQYDFIRKVVDTIRLVGCLLACRCSRSRHRPISCDGAHASRTRAIGVRRAGAVGGARRPICRRTTARTAFAAQRGQWPRRDGDRRFERDRPCGRG
jgi:CDGSH-type Zn-finger protein